METYNPFQEIYYDDFEEVENAGGDIMNNPTGSCVLNLSYPDQRFDMLLDMVSQTRNAYAKATAEKEQAHQAYLNCRRRVFCNAGPKNTVFKSKIAAESVALQAFEASKAELEQATKENKEDRLEFDDCKKDEAIRLDREAEERERAAELEIESEIVGISTSEATSETKKDYMVYGLMALAAVGIIGFGFFMIKK